MSDERDEDIFPMLENHVRMKPDEILCPGDMDKIIAVARRRIAWNKVKYAEMSLYVNGDIAGEKLNPEYIARAEETRALRDKLRMYCHSNEAASDELFRIKTEADAAGKDWTQACRDEIAKMEGNHIVASAPEPVVEEAKPEEPPRTLGGKILHSLWSMGVPVDRIFKKTKFDIGEVKK